MTKMPDVHRLWAEARSSNAEHDARTIARREATRRANEAAQAIAEALFSDEPCDLNENEPLISTSFDHVYIEDDEA